MQEVVKIAAVGEWDDEVELTEFISSVFEGC
jgi:hypothetical protein